MELHSWQNLANKLDVFCNYKLWFSNVKLLSQNNKVLIGKCEANNLQWNISAKSLAFTRAGA